MTKEEQMRGMLVTLANHPHCNYAHPANGEGPYGIGVTDGHRCVALTVQKFLKALDAPPADPETVTPAEELSPLAQAIRDDKNWDALSDAIEGAQLRSAPYRVVPNDPRTPIYDDRGRWVADCRDVEIAQRIVALLNAQTPAISTKGRDG